MNGPVRRLSIALFAGFFVLLGAVTWFQVIHADSLKADPRNPRPALSERGKERGLIVTIDGEVVAQSVEDPEDPRSFARTYPGGDQLIQGRAGMHRIQAKPIGFATQRR